MEENEGMEERNLATEKYYEEVEIKFIDKNSKSESFIAPAILKAQREYEGKKVTEYEIYLKIEEVYVQVATINENGKIELTELGNELNLHGLEANTVDLNKLEENLKEIDAKTKEEIEQKKDNKEKEEDESIKDKDEKEEDEEEPEKDDEEDDKEKKEIAKKYNVKSNQVIHINAKSEKITEDKTFEGLVEYAKGYEDIYVIPGKDAYTWKTIGRKENEKEFTEIEQANIQIHGKNPDVTIQRIDNDKITEVRPLAMYDIDGKTAVAIVKDEYGRPEELYCRKQEGEQKYFGTVIPEAKGKNVRQLEFKERSFMDSKNTSARDLSNKADAVAKAKDLDERGVPSKEKGVQVEEIEGNAEQNLKLTKEEIKDDLYKRMGITEKMKAGFMPGQLAHLDKQLDEKADRILKLIVDNKNMTYDDAVKKEEEDNKQREEGGITPGENRRKHE